MKYFLYVMLFLLYACESNNVIKNTKKNQNIQMEVTTEPTINIKK